MPYNFTKAFNGRNARRRRRKTVGTIRRYADPIVREFTQKAGAALGEYLGGPEGAELGSRLGRYAGAPRRSGGLRGLVRPISINDISGMGDYKISRHGFKSDRGSMGRSARGGKVAMEKGQMRIAHSEYIGELISSGVTGSTNFVSQSYGLNPANEGTFPWLSSIAINFQDYKFHKCVFEYRPLVSESTSTTAATLTSMGSIILATQYDSILGPYTNKPQMENSDFSVSCKPSSHVLHAIECNPRYNPLGVLYTSNNLSLTQGANGSDIRMQNLGIFEMASVNIPIAANTAIDLGEIWVHYDVELFKPVLEANLNGVQSAKYEASVFTQFGNASPFGVTAGVTQMIAVPNNIIPLTFTKTTFTFPLSVTIGSFLCVYTTSGAATAVNFGVVSVTNGTLGAVNELFEVFGGSQPSLAGQTSSCITFIVNVNAPGAQLCTVTIPAPTLYAVPTSVSLVVTPYNSAM